MYDDETQDDDEFDKTDQSIRLLKFHTDISIRLLKFHDDLNNMIAAMSFYHEAVDLVLSRNDSAVLLTTRQKNGAFRIGSWLVDTGEHLSDILEEIRQDINGGEKNEERE